MSPMTEASKSHFGRYGRDLIQSRNERHIRAPTAYCLGFLSIELFEDEEVTVFLPQEFEQVSPAAPESQIAPALKPPAMARAASGLFSPKENSQLIAQDNYSHIQ